MKIDLTIDDLVCGATAGFLSCVVVHGPDAMLKVIEVLRASATEVQMVPTDTDLPTFNTLPPVSKQMSPKPE